MKNRIVIIASLLSLFMLVLVPEISAEDQNQCLRILQVASDGLNVAKEVLYQKKDLLDEFVQDLQMMADYERLLRWTLNKEMCGPALKEAESLLEELRSRYLAAIKRSKENTKFITGVLKKTELIYIITQNAALINKCVSAKTKQEIIFKEHEALKKPYLSKIQGDEILAAAQSGLENLADPEVKQVIINIEINIDQISTEIPPKKEELKKHHGEQAKKILYMASGAFLSLFDIFSPLVVDPWSKAFSLGMGINLMTKALP